MSTCLISLEASQARNLRLISIKRSSVSARNPKQAQLLTGLGGHRGKFYFKLVGDTSGAESADPAKLVQRIQARQQRFGAAHGKARDGAGVAGP